jgi:hypothetical protein
MEWVSLKPWVRIRTNSCDFANHLPMFIFLFSSCLFSKFHMPGIVLLLGIKWIWNAIISLKPINALENSKDIMIPVGNRNYLVCNLALLDLNHLITDYRTNYKAERYIVNFSFSIISYYRLLLMYFLYKWKFTAQVRWVCRFYKIVKDKKS